MAPRGDQSNSEGGNRARARVKGHELAIKLLPQTAGCATRVPIDRRRVRLCRNPVVGEVEGFHYCKVHIGMAQTAYEAYVKDCAILDNYDNVHERGMKPPRKTT